MVFKACTVGLQGKRKSGRVSPSCSRATPHWTSEDRILKRPSTWNVLMGMRDVKPRGQARQCRGFVVGLKFDDVLISFRLFFF